MTIFQPNGDHTRHFNEIGDDEGVHADYAMWSSSNNDFTMNNGDDEGVRAFCSVVENGTTRT